jgi:outer membrane protein assembly factor BamE (lipoprotein component of BamABCDE complex)
MRKSIWIVLFSVLVFSVGCGAMLGTSSKSGRKIDRDKLAQVEKGKTTMTEVEKLLGKPQATEKGEAGTVWTYQFMKVSGFGGSESEAVAIRFDANGVVAEVSEQAWKY